MTAPDMITATQDGDCASCGKVMLRGSRILTDGTRAWHSSCKWPGPAGSTPTLPAPSDHFIQVAAWIPIERVELVLKAIREARGW